MADNMKELNKEEIEKATGGFAFAMDEKLADKLGKAPAELADKLAGIEVKSAAERLGLGYADGVTVDTKPIDLADGGRKH